MKSGKEGGTGADSMAIAYGMTPSIDLHYMFGDDFLVRPIVELGQRKVEIVFPDDGFVDFYNGEVYQAGIREVDAPLERIPLFIKPGAVIPYNYYADGVVPTLEKENFAEAILLTAPKYEREAVFYTDSDSVVFTSVPTASGYRVASDKKCNRRMIIVIGKAEISADVEVDNLSYDKESNRTTAVLSGEWTVLEVK